MTFQQSLCTIPAALFRGQCMCKENFAFQNPFNCAIEELAPNLQLDVINLQCNDKLKGKYQEKTLTEFSQCLSSHECTQNHTFMMIYIKSHYSQH